MYCSVKSWLFHLCKNQDSFLLNFIYMVQKICYFFASYCFTFCKVININNKKNPFCISESTASDLPADAIFFSCFSSKYNQRKLSIVSDHSNKLTHKSVFIISFNGPNTAAKFIFAFIVAQHSVLFLLVSLRWQQFKHVW